MTSRRSAVRVAIGLGVVAGLAALLYQRFTTPAFDVNKLLGQVHEEMVQKSVEQACADPNSDFCKFLIAQALDGGLDGRAGPSPDPNR